MAGRSNKPLRTGQVTSFIIFGIVVLITLGVLLMTSPYAPGGKASQKRTLDTKMSNQEDFQSAVNSYRTSVEACLKQYSREAVYLCKKENSRACDVYIKNYLKLRGADCFAEPTFQGLSVTANPPFTIDITETLERINIKVSINTLLTLGGFEATLDSYSSSVLKEGDELETEPTSSFDIDGQEASLSPPAQAMDREQYSNDEAIISYNQAPGQELKDAIDALPLTKRELMFNSSQLEPSMLSEEARALLTGLLNDEIITFDTRQTDFETIRKKLLAFEEVKNVTRNTKSYSSNYMALRLMRNAMRGRGAIGPNDPFYRFQWYLQNRGQFAGMPGADISITEAWNVTLGSPNVTIAIIDEGIFANPDITPNLLRDKSYNLLTGSYDISPLSRQDTHGTHVAGIIASLKGNNLGIAGVCPRCRIISMTVLSGEEGTDSRTVLNAVLLAVGRGAKIVTMSLGGTYRSAYEEYVFKTLASKGIIFVAAAGNDGRSEKNYPAAYQGVISVGATDNTDRVASFSNHGDWVDLYAPGDLIISDCGVNRYCFKSGTSMATPMVTGVIGLMRSVRPGMTPDEALSVLWENAEKLGPDVARLNAGKAVKSLDGR